MSWWEARQPEGNHGAEAEAERSHLCKLEVERELIGNDETSNPTPQWHISFQKISHLNLSQTVLPTADYAFKHMSLWQPFSFKTPHSPDLARNKKYAYRDILTHTTLPDLARRKKRAIGTFLLCNVGAILQTLLSLHSQYLHAIFYYSLMGLDQLSFPNFMQKSCLLLLTFPNSSHLMPCQTSLLHVFLCDCVL